MKRKIIKSGPSTMVVSLPSKWAKQFNLEAGSEIEAMEDANMLIFYAQGESKNEAASMEVTENRKAVRAWFGSLYKLGYDEIKIQYKTSEELEFISYLLQDGYIGFEMIEEKKNHVIVKKVSDIDFEQFSNMLRRLFLVIIDMGNELENALKNKDMDLLKKIVMMEKSTNKFANFCRRAINKRIIKDFRKNASLYYIIEELERIGDAYKDLASYYIEANGKSNKALLGRCNSYFRKAYELFYEFDLAKLEKFINEKKELLKELSRTKENESFFMHTLIEDTANLKGALTTINI